MEEKTQVNWLQKIAFGALVALLVLLPFNALLTTWIRYGLGLDLPVNMWKELLVVLICVLAAINMWRGRLCPRLVVLDWLIVAFIGLGIVSAVAQTRVPATVIFGFKYDLEFLVLFLAVRHGFEWSGAEIKRLARAAVFCAVVVIGFALAQKWMLPRDFLKLFGYSDAISNWEPGGKPLIFHIIGDWPGIPRLQSTLSGPNQLAAYLLIALPWLVIWGVAAKKIWAKWLSALAVVGGATAMFYTYSRSAYVAAVVAAVVGIFLLVKNKTARGWLVVGTGLLVAAVAAVVWAAPSLREQVLVRQGSSEGHVARGVEAMKLIAENPLGYGIGSAGPAANWMTGVYSRVIPESWYLQIGVEMGVLGMGLFVVILTTLLLLLLKRYRSQKRLEYIALSVGLVGIAVASLFLHSWEEAAVALGYWALAGVYLSGADPAAV